MRQSIPAASLEILVVDNSEIGQQGWVCAYFAPGTEAMRSPVVRYVHEPCRGLASARNRGIREAKGGLVVFLDDDEKPVNTSWLETLTSVAVRTGADVTFGPVVPEFESLPSAHRSYVTELFTRDHRLASGATLSNKVYKLGTGNSCFLVQTCFANGWSFDPRFNDAGGEDVEFLGRLKERGARFVWAPDAPVLEFVPTSRLQPEYLAGRRFRQGQLRTYLHVTSAVRWDRLLFWMAVGALQAGAHSLASAVLFLVGRLERAEEHRIRAWGGLGKVLWHPRFSRRSYAISAQGQE